MIIKSVVIKNSETDYNMQFQNGLKSSCSQERYFHIDSSTCTKARKYIDYVCRVYIVDYVT